MLIESGCCCCCCCFCCCCHRQPLSRRHHVDVEVFVVVVASVHVMCLSQSMNGKAQSEKLRQSTSTAIESFGVNMAFVSSLALG